MDGGILEVPQARPKQRIDELNGTGAVYGRRAATVTLCKVWYMAELLRTGAWTERESYFCCRWNSRKK